MDTWDAKDYSLLGAALLGVKNDVESTKGLVARGGAETNPMLSDNPSKQELDRYGLLAGLIGGGTAAVIPSEYRKPFLGAWAGLEHGLSAYNAGYDTKKGGGKFGDAVTKAIGPALLGALAGKFLSSPSTDIGIGSVDTTPTLSLTKSF